jgi:hypothetical protein
LEIACDLANLLIFNEKNFDVKPFDCISNGKNDDILYEIAPRYIIDFSLGQLNCKIIDYNQFYECCAISCDFLTDYVRLPEIALKRVCFHITNLEYIKPELKRLNAEITASTYKIETIYDINNLYTLLFFDISKAYEDLTANLKLPLVKVCSNCGRFFLVRTRSDTKYCHYPSPQNPAHTCQIYRTQINSSSKNETKNLYRKIYGVLQVRSARNPDNLEIVKEFEEFKALSKQWRIDVKVGERIESEFLNWLKTYEKN